MSLEMSSEERRARTRPSRRWCSSDIGVDGSSVRLTTWQKSRLCASSEVRNVSGKTRSHFDLVASRRNAVAPKSKLMNRRRKSDSAWSREMTYLNEKCRLLRQIKVLSELVHQQDNELLRSRKINKVMRMTLKRRQEEAELLRKQMNKREEEWRKAKDGLVRTMKRQVEQANALSSALDQSIVTCDEQAQVLNQVTARASSMASEVKKLKGDVVKSKQAVATLSRQLMYEEEDKDRAQLLLEEQRSVVEEMSTRLKANAQNQERRILLVSKAVQMLRLNMQNKVEQLKGKVATSSWPRSSERNITTFALVDGMADVVEYASQYILTVTSAQEEQYHYLSAEQYVTSV